jgi:phosphoribosylamine--glycine ligase
MVYVAPGNGGTARDPRLVNVDITDPAALADFVVAEHVAMTLVGPEQPLAAGIVNLFRARGLKVFGPTREAAQLESSKDFAKAFMHRHGIPTAQYQTFTDVAQAHAYIDAQGAPIVIKADGLAAGKGVVIAFSAAEATAAFDAMFAGCDAPVVLEEFLEGEEASLFVLTDGTSLMPFGSAQDHKRVGEGDTGPNTGGMGAYSPAPVLTAELERRAIDEIVAPTVKAMAEDGIPFSGVLYAGLMLTAQGPKLIEYNARFGDPECQVLMMRYQGDLAALLLAVAEGRLGDQPPATFSPETAMTVVMAANGYPGTPAVGGAIRGIAAAEATGATVFQAGTRQQGSSLVAAGGRVLAVTALGADIRTARTIAYRGVDAIDFPTGFCRRDIGWRELAR